MRRRHRLVNSNSPLEVFSCLCEKKLQAVGDIGFRGAGFKVDGADIGEGIFFAEPPDDAFPGNVVGQAPKGLQTHDVGRSGVNKLHHFGGQEPPFAGFLTGGHKSVNALEVFREGRHACHWCSVKCFAHDAAEMLKPADHQPGSHGFQARSAEDLGLIDVVIEAVEEECGQVTEHRFRAFINDLLHDAEIGGGMVLK